MEVLKHTSSNNTTSRIATKVFPFAKYSKKSTMETVGNIILTCKEYMKKYPNLKRCMIKIDDTGVDGGVTDRLREVVSEERLPYTIIPVNNGSAATDDYYANLGSQIWGEVRDLLEENFSNHIPETVSGSHKETVGRCDSRPGKQAVCFNNGLSAAVLYRWICWNNV